MRAKCQGARQDRRLFNRKLIVSKQRNKCANSRNETKEWMSQDMQICYCCCGSWLWRKMKYENDIRHSLSPYSYLIFLIISSLFVTILHFVENLWLIPKWSIRFSFESDKSSVWNRLETIFCLTTRNDSVQMLIRYSHQTQLELFYSISKNCVCVIRICHVYLSLDRTWWRWLKKIWQKPSWSWNS